MNKKALQAISYGMYLVTTIGEDGKKYGCIMNTLTQVTSEEPKLCFHLNKENETTKQLLQSRKVAISILSIEVDPNIITTFGFQSSLTVDKFKNISYKMIDGLPVYQEKMVSYFIGKVIETVDMDSHISFFVKVVSGEVLSDIEKMTYDYYHQVIKGKAPKKAPTYIEDTKEEDVYICDVCGYRVKGPLPDDFICPICGMSRNHFKKQT